MLWVFIVILVIIYLMFDTTDRVDVIKSHMERMDRYIAHLENTKTLNMSPIDNSRVIRIHTDTKANIRIIPLYDSVVGPLYSGGQAFYYDIIRPRLMRM